MLRTCTAHATSEVWLQCYSMHMHVHAHASVGSSPMVARCSVRSPSSRSTLVRTRQLGTSSRRRARSGAPSSSRLPPVCIAAALTSLFGVGASASELQRRQVWAALRRLQAEADEQSTTAAGSQQPKKALGSASRLQHVTLSALREAQPPRILRPVAAADGQKPKIFCSTLVGLKLSSDDPQASPQ